MNKTEAIIRLCNTLRVIKVTPKATSGFFNTEAERVIFLLTHVDGKRRNDELGIRRVMYCDKEKAKQWYKSLARLIHPDKCNHELASEAFNELQNLHHIMTL